MPTTEPGTDAQQLQVLTIVWAAQLAGPIVFAALAFVLTQGGSVPPNESLRVLVPFAQVAAIALPLAGWYVGGLVAAPKPGDKRSAIEILRVGQLIAGALGEAGALLAIVIFMVTGEKVLLAALLPMLFLFLSIRPTRDRLDAVRRRLEQLQTPGAR